MAITLTSDQLKTLRQNFVMDFYTAALPGPSPPAAPIAYGSHYNLVKKAAFFTDAQLQAFCDQVVLEEPQLLASYTDAGATLPPFALDPLTALYRLIRMRAWAIQLTNREFISTMHVGNQSEAVANALMKNMESQIERDKIYTEKTGATPGGFTIERG